MTREYGSASPSACVVSHGACEMGESAIQAVEALKHTDAWTARNHCGSRPRRR